MEFTGSCPEKIASQEKFIMQKKKENRIEGNMQAASYFEMVPASIARETMTTQERECGNPWLCSMIGVLFGAEMCKRRCRHRRCRRWM
jgi:hypothetical protein